MAEEATEVPQQIDGGEPESAQDMEVEAVCGSDPLESSVGNHPNGAGKRGRPEGGDDAAEGEEVENGAFKKQKVETSVEEDRLKKLEENKEGAEEPKENEEEKENEGGEASEHGEGTGDARLGPKVFTTSVEMFDYFNKFLHFWTPNLDINKYEHMVLLELLKKGHAEPNKKIGGGIKAFQVRFHPTWKSRCFFLVHTDGNSDDFSFRKCVDNILPLPENMKIQSARDGIKSFQGKKGGGHGGGGGRGGRGGGRGGQGRGRRGWK